MRAETYQKKRRRKLEPWELLLRGLTDLFTDTAQNTIVVPSVIPAGMYRKLLMLCHPDKHGNSEMSNEVTRWLVEQVKR